MDCSKVQEEISSLIYDELDPGQAALIRDHIDGCDDCRAEWKRQETTRAALDRWPGVECRLDAASIVANRGGTFAGTRPKTPWLSRPLLVALAAGVIIAISLIAVGVEVERFDGGMRLTFGRPAGQDAIRGTPLEQEVRTLVRNELAGGVGELMETVAQRFGEAALQQEQRQAQFVRNAWLQREDDMRRTRSMIRRVAHDSATATVQTRHLVDGLADLVRYADIKIPQEQN